MVEVGMLELASDIWHQFQASQPQPNAYVWLVGMLEKNRLMFFGFEKRFVGRLSDVIIRNRRTSPNRISFRFVRIHTEVGQPWTEADSFRVGMLGFIWVCLRNRNEWHNRL